MLAPQFQHGYRNKDFLAGFNGRGIGARFIAYVAEKGSPDPAGLGARTGAALPGSTALLTSAGTSSGP